MSDNTSILNIPQVASNQNQKETTINTGIAILEASMNDTLVIDLGAADHALTVDEFTKFFCFRALNNTVPQNLDTPAPAGTYSGKRVFVVENLGTDSVIVRPGGLGTGTVSVDPGVAVLLKTDGTSITILSSGAAPAAGATFVSLADVPNAYTGAGKKAVRVKGTEDGLEFFTIPATTGFSMSGKPDAAQKVNIIIAQAWKLPTSLTGSNAYIGTPPSLSMAWTINKVSGGTTTPIGTMTFNTSGVPTPTFTADITFASGDILQIVAPSSQDATGADIAFSFAGILQ